jgi:hypothetical protein
MNNLSIALLASALLSSGANMSEFQLADLTGAPVTLTTSNADATAVIFIATKCPISNDYNTRMNAIYREFSTRGVQFVFVNSNATEPAQEVAAHAQQHQFGFQVYKDNGNLLADKLGAQATPEVFVFDRQGGLRYHGYVDDSRNGQNIKTEGLKLALNALLSGKSPDPAQTKAFGCTIKRVKKAS